MSADVGADVESICSKCGDVWHVVVAKVGDKIVKVHCKQCGKVHRYTPPGGTPAAVKKARAPRAAGAAKGTRAAAAREAEGPTVAADMSRPVRTYKPAESYAAGDRIEHPTFGTGVVEASPGPGKASVFFPAGRKVLAMAKATSTLARPGAPNVPPEKI